MQLVVVLYILQGFAEVEDLLKKEGICIAVTEKLIKDSGVSSEAGYDNIVTSLVKKSNSRGTQSFSLLIYILFFKLLFQYCVVTGGLYYYTIT